MTPTTTTAPFAAADGRNLDACADGTCEVFVQTGDSLPNASGAGPVRITAAVAGVSIAHTDAGINPADRQPGVRDRRRGEVLRLRLG